MSVIEAELIARHVDDEFIGVLTLNKEKSLNALDLEMVELMTHYLLEWKDDKRVVGVFLQGKGEKAFCAGGDVVSLYRSMKSHREEMHLASHVKLEQTPAFCEEFFTKEYQLDYLIHCYPKPFVTWGSGIVLGGGLGLFAASQFAIATEKSRIAMPEITIGLFPDVGGSYFLNKMPSGVGLFLGLTGANFNGVDACNIHLASHKVDSGSKQKLVDKLLAADAINEQSVTDLLDDLQILDSRSFDGVDGKLKGVQEQLSGLEKASDLADVVSMLRSLASEQHGNAWLNKSLNTLDHGSPITAHLVFEQMKRGKGASLADCFRQELNMAMACSMYGEFEEGVRALLIEKDFQPNWLFKKIDDVPSALIDGHFSCANEASHPLQLLEETYGVLHD